MAIYKVLQLEEGRQVSIQKSCKKKFNPLHNTGFSHWIKGGWAPFCRGEKKPKQAPGHRKGGRDVKMEVAYNSKVGLPSVQTGHPTAEGAKRV